MKTKTFILLTLAFIYFSFTTNRVIKGKVVSDADNSPLPGVSIYIKNSKSNTTTDIHGNFKLEVPTNTKHLIASSIGYVSQEITISSSDSVFIRLKEDQKTLDESVVIRYGTVRKKEMTGSVSAISSKKIHSAEQAINGRVPGVSIQNSNSRKLENDKSRLSDVETSNEEYAKVHQNVFQNVSKEPLSTFSIDVDKAGYSNVRRMLNDGYLPPKDAVRIEEMINYFDYNYPQPTGNDPVSINTEYSDSPWNEGLKLFKIGIQAKKIPVENLPASNLVFLIDVSGSMSDENKLPLVKRGFELLVDQLRPKDKVAIVVYAGAAGMVLSPTAGNEKEMIKKALNSLSSGGSTAGGEGITLAYKLALENFVKGGNNRVIMASDGDFNVGVSNENDLKTLIEEKRESGVFLSILGFGLGNYKDNKMELLADKGNGNYAYIDNIQEAEKVFVKEFGGTLFTIAKDMKLQLEFNPAKVSAYRLIGYENRILAAEDFNNDRKDAGEIGSGHTVTAVYEIIPTNVNSTYLSTVDKLKYQKPSQEKVDQNDSDEVLTIKLRYKSPDGDKSLLMTKPVKDESISFENTTENFKLATAVTEFGLLLRQSEFAGKANYDQAIDIAKKAKGEDEEGYRAELIKLIKTAKLLSRKSE
ncbi:MAG: YfbK domain-containing protein [Leadbetterella sp.]